MAHLAFEQLDGITLPSEKCIVTGRVSSWLKQKDSDIEAASCYVCAISYPEHLKAETLIKVFIDVAWKLQANGGVNVWLDGIEDVLKDLSKIKNYGFVDFVLNPYIDYDYTYRVADSLRLEKQSSKDKFPDHISIYLSWKYAWEAVINGKSIYLDYSEVRDKDGKSTGRDSFISIINNFVHFIKHPTLTNFLINLSDINATIKKGGYRKSGAVTTSLSLCKDLNEHPFFAEYINIPFEELAFVKKSVILPDCDSLEKHQNILRDNLDVILNKYNNGEIFIEKEIITAFAKNPLISNVCRGITLAPDDQCLIGHINAGKIFKFEQIIEAYAEMTNFLVKVHNLQVQRGVKMVDKQIAVGITGFANLLRNHQIKYKSFIKILYKRTHNILSCKDLTTKEYQLVQALQRGMKLAATIGLKAGMRAVLTIEPCESCSRRYKDYLGYSLVPNIDPPNTIPGMGIEKRHSDTGIVDENGNNINPLFDYGKDIETTSDITTEEHFQLWDGIQTLMDNTNKAHMSSYEQWGEMSIYQFYQWYESNLTTLYYNRRDIGTTHLNKGNTLKRSFKKYQEQTEDTRCYTCGD